MQVLEAIKSTVNNGFSVEKYKKHLYKRTNGKFSILHFDGESNLLHTGDETFDSVDEAARMFLEYVKDKPKPSN